MHNLHDRARRRYVATHPLPESLWQWALQYHPMLEGLTGEELVRLRELTTLFMHEKEFEGAEGQSLTDAMRLSIAVQACLPILNLGIDWYDNWKTVVVVPTGFLQEHRMRDRAGVIHEWKERDVGESWHGGPVVLSWDDVEASGWADGFNVVIHEAAHRLDLTDGSANGRPALHPGMDAREWFAVCSAAFKDLEAAAAARKRSKIDRYAAASDAEFFAVLSEYFFERGRIVLHEYPAVYRLFAAFYRQDPAARQDRRMTHFDADRA